MLPLNEEDLERAVHLNAYILNYAQQETLVADAFSEVAYYERRPQWCSNVTETESFLTLFLVDGTIR